MKILALDLGKFNTMCCFFDTKTRKHSFLNAPTERNYLNTLFKNHKIDLVVMEACGPSGWINDLASSHGLKTLDCSTNQDARSQPISDSYHGSINPAKPTAMEGSPSVATHWQERYLSSARGHPSDTTNGPRESTTASAANKRLAKRKQLWHWLERSQCSLGPCCVMRKTGRPRI